MIPISDCAFCVHRRSKLKDGWIPTCDAFPDGKPHDLNEGNLHQLPECNNGIGFEPIEKEDETAPK